MMMRLVIWDAMTISLTVMIWIIKTLRFQPYYFLLFVKENPLPNHLSNFYVLPAIFSSSYHGIVVLFSFIVE